MNQQNHSTNWAYLTHLKKLPHALLLWGPKEQKLQLFAENFASWLLCVGHKENLACGQCASCQWIAAATHPDLLIITPESNHIKVETIREIRAFSENKSQAGGYRIIIISPAEAMNVSASNALLKVLEEPFDKTMFLLVGHDLSRILPTVLSRCQKIHFPLSVKSKESEPTLKTRQAIESLMHRYFSKDISPIELVEKIKSLEKESQLPLENLLDMILTWTFQQIKINNLPKWHDFYDRILQIKKQIAVGFPINQVLWLEDLFYAS
jgi:DNA polymerase III delta' subunit